MTVAIWIISILAYLFIGGMVYRLIINSDDKNIVCVLFWPIIVVIFLTIAQGEEFAKIIKNKYNGKNAKK